MPQFYGGGFMSAKVRWSGNPKEPTIKGMQYASDYQEWMRINFRSNKEMRDAVKEWERRTHRDIDDLYYEMQQIHLQELAKEAKQIDIDEAIKIINDSIPENVGRGWFVNADSDYKPRLFSYVMDTKGLLNAGWNVAYDHYKWQMKEEGKTPLSFKKWLFTPQTLYRGHRGQKLKDEDRFHAYSTRRSVAEKFAGKYDNSQISEIKIRPVDTLGAYQTTGESEYWIPRWKVKL